MVAVTVLCAPTEVEARWLAGPSALSTLQLRTGRLGPMPSPEEAEAYAFTPAERAIVDESMSSHLIGTPETVWKDWSGLQERTAADELMISTRMHSYAARGSVVDVGGGSVGVGGSAGGVGRQGGRAAKPASLLLKLANAVPSWGFSGPSSKCHNVVVSCLYGTQHHGHGFGPGNAPGQGDLRKVARSDRKYNELDPSLRCDCETVIEIHRLKSQLDYGVSTTVAAFDQWGAFLADGALTATAWIDTRCHIPKKEAQAELRTGNGPGRPTGGRGKPGSAATSRRPTSTPCSGPRAGDHRPALP